MEAVTLSPALIVAGAVGFGGLPRGYSRVWAIQQWVRGHVSFRSGSSNGSTSAMDTIIERSGVCRRERRFRPAGRRDLYAGADAVGVSVAGVVQRGTAILLSGGGAGGHAAEGIGPGTTLGQHRRLLPCTGQAARTGTASFDY